jgi:protein-disulfide isomerase
MKNLIWGVVIVVAVAGLLFLGKESNNIEPPYEAGVVHELDHTKGLATSTLVITEYADFQCPACRSYYPIMRELFAEYGDRVLFVYRNFPLTSIHPNAEFAARAAEAAGKQDKFWEMYDLLFEKQNEWANVADVYSKFESYATLLNLNLSQFKTDWTSKETKNLVRAQKAHAVQAGLQGTPTFFFNKEKIQNPTSIEQFKILINDALSKNLKL